MNFFERIFRAGPRAFAALACAVWLAALSPGALAQAGKAPAPAPAAPAASAASGAKQAPTVVDVGIYLNNVPSVNLKEKKFQADFYLWFRWTGDDVNPLENFEIINAHIDAKEGPLKKKFGDVNYGLFRIEATFFRNFSLSTYPLDDHPLKIQIEDTSAGAGEIVFRADKAATGLSPKIDVPGWGLGKYESYTSSTRYATNFGDLSTGAPDSRYPRFTMMVELKRSGVGNFIKLFSMLFLATALAFCAFRIRSDYIDARIALAASGVFLAVLTQNTLSTNLPESDSFGMGDQLYFLTMGFIVLVFVGTIHTFKVQLSGAEEQAAKLSHRMGFALPVAYVAIAAVIVLISGTRPPA